MIVNCIRKVDPDLRILFVDDESPDGTADAIQKEMLTDKNISIMKRDKKLGLGTAYKDALNYVSINFTPEYVLTMDADGSHMPEDIPSLLNKARGNDLIIGSRYISGGRSSMSLWRKAISIFLIK